MGSEVIWTNQAWFDFEEIIEYTEQKAEYYVDEVATAIRESTQRLKTFPYQGRKVPELSDPFLRELIVFGYRLIYKVKEEKVYILTIIHTAQDFQNIIRIDGMIK